MVVDGTNRLLAAAEEIQQFCRSRHWRFCFIDGIAVQHWGQARLTRDADVTVFTGIGDEARFIDELIRSFESRVGQARDFALKHRVLLLRATNGVPLDVTLGALPFEEKAVASARVEKIVTGAGCSSQHPVRWWFSRSSPIDPRTGSTSRGSS